MIAIGAFACALVALFVAAHWWMTGGVFTTARFDSAVWLAPQTSETDTTCHRGHMAADIKERVLKREMTREDVERVLGKPDGYSTAGEYQYILGMCSGLLMDYDNLHVYFDSDGKYERAAIVQH